jgi:hypothetical protein
VVDFLAFEFLGDQSNESELDASNSNEKNNLSLFSIASDFGKQSLYIQSDFACDRRRF